MRKTISKLFNRRTLSVILLLVTFVAASFFLIPVSNSRLISSSWCGVGGNYFIRSWAFFEDGSFHLTKIHLGGPDVSWFESGTWVRDGGQVQISSIELNNPRSYYLTLQLRPFGWGTRLWAYGSDFERVGDRSSLIIISPCK